MNSTIGKRICIVGFSSSGKSTLAHVIAQKKGLELLHLDQLYHIPNTDWVGRPRTEFHKDVVEFIKKDAWVIDGSYRHCLPQRLQRADTLIILEATRAGSVYRFVKRGLGFGGKRFGVPEGMPDGLRWAPIWYTLRSGRRKKYGEYEKLARENPHVNMIRLNSFKEIDQFVAGL